MNARRRSMTGEDVLAIVVVFVAFVCLLNVVPGIAAALAKAGADPMMPPAVREEIVAWIVALAAAVTILIASAFVSREALALVATTVAVLSVFAAAILTDQISSHWGSGGPDRWPTTAQAAILADAGRWVLGGIVLLVAAFAIRKAVWSEVLVATTAVLAVIVVVLAGRDQIDGRLAAAPDAVKAPTITMAIRDAELIGAMPSVGTGVQVMLVTPQRDADGNITAQQTKSLPAKVGGAGCRPSSPASGAVASPSAGTPSAPVADALEPHRVDCQLELSRGKDDANVLDVLGRMRPDGRVIIAPR